MKSFVIICFFACVFYTSCSNDNLNQEQGDEYCMHLLDTTNINLYSFAPFTENEWQTLSYSEKLEKRQVPSSNLQKMNCKELFYQFVFCDLSKDIYVFNSLQYGFKTSMSRLNMIQELIDRPDAGTFLIGMLEDIKISKIAGLDCRHFFLCLQMIVAQTEIINSLNHQDIRRLIKCFQQQEEEIIRLSEVNTDWEVPIDLTTIMLAFGNIMIGHHYEPFNYLIESNIEINAFMQGDNIRNMDVCVLIDKQIKGFLLTKK